MIPTHVLIHGLIIQQEAHLLVASTALDGIDPPIAIQKTTHSSLPHRAGAANYDGPCSKATTEESI